MPAPLRAAAVRSLWIDAPGARLHAWFVSPPGDPPWPAVVLAHGWAAVKEMNLDYFAAAFRDAGIAALVFDHRGFGASEGPRGDIDPALQIADYGSALDAAERMDGVDAGRLGVWGTSYSGGHVLCVARDDRRVRAAVAQVPTISGGEATRRRARTPPATEYVPAADTGGHDFDGDGGDPVDPRELPPAPDGEYPDADRWRFYAELPAERRRTWRNRITARSLERYAAYEPGACMPDVAVPLLVVLAEDDTVTPSDLIRDAVRASGGNVATLAVPGGHYAVYTNHRDRTARAAAAFMADHLR
jgi:dipeptidyl aminopeptidase/acylaminoacyl peptidase